MRYTLTQDPWDLYHFVNCYKIGTACLLASLCAPVQKLKSRIKEINVTRRNKFYAVKTNCDSFGETPSVALTVTLDKRVDLCFSSSSGCLPMD